MFYFSVFINELGGKRMKKFILALMAMALIFGADLRPASAQTERTPGINKSQRRQHKRIRHGVESGNLTKEEAAKLKSDQKAIHAEKKVAKADGTVTKEERRKIRADQSRTSKDIHQEKHDAQKKH